MRLINGQSPIGLLCDPQNSALIATEGRFAYFAQRLFGRIVCFEHRLFHRCIIDSFIQRIEGLHERLHDPLKIGKRRWLVERFERDRIILQIRQGSFNLTEQTQLRNSTR